MEAILSCAHMRSYVFGYISFQLLLLQCSVQYATAQCSNNTTAVCMVIRQCSFIVVLTGYTSVELQFNLFDCL